MKSVKIATVAVLVALSISTNYAMISLYNVKLMDFFVFIGGFCFGPAVGMLTGIISWVVYGTLNPVGFDFRIWFATMFAELLYGVVGGIMGKNLISKEADALKVKVGTASIFFGMLGMLLTFAYDVITNAVFGYFWYQSIILGVIMGFVPFGLVHVLSNAFFFSLGCVPVIKVINNLARGNAHGSDHK
jgi:hypothetical protein